jgi:hypothetical protein
MPTALQNSPPKGDILSIKGNMPFVSVSSPKDRRRTTAKGHRCFSTVLPEPSQKGNMTDAIPVSGVNWHQRFYFPPKTFCGRYLCRTQKGFLYLLWFSVSPYPTAKSSEGCKAIYMSNATELKPVRAVFSHEGTSGRFCWELFATKGG